MSSGSPLFDAPSSGTADLLFLHHPVPMWITDDDTLEFLAVNEAAVAKYGYSREEFAAMTAADIRPPEDVARLKQTVTRPEWRARGLWRHITKRGETLYVEVAAHKASYHGRQASVVICYDVTPRVRAEERAREAAARLEQSERKYRELVESLQDIVWAMDAQGIVTYVSPAIQRFGYAPDELVGDHFGRVVHAEDMDRALDTVQQALAGHSSNIEVRLLPKNGGDPRFIRTSCRALIEDGRTIGVTGVLMDLTEHHLAQEQLRAAQRLEAIGRLAGGVAHDFNNLLASVTGFTELACAALPDEHEARPDLQQVLIAAHRAAALTQKLLAFGRKQFLQPASVLLETVVKELEPMLKSAVGDRIALTLISTGGPHAVRIDREQFEHVLVHLAMNAREAMPQGGTLTIATLDADTPVAAGRTARAALLQVSDTGLGMDEETRAHVFEPFFTTKPFGQAAGMGLPMVYGFVQQSGGTIGIRSAQGAGTTISIALPIDAEAIVPVAPGTDDARDEDSPPAPTVLITEDEPSVRKLVQRTLEREGYAVLSAADPEEALQICRAHAGPIGVLLTDVVMPGINGVELARRAAALRPQLPVVFMSGYSNHEIDEVAGSAVAILQKPFTAASLLTAVHAALGN